MSTLLDRFAGLQKSGNGWTAKCPAHDDHRNSLSIGYGEGGRILLKCHASCELDDILAAAHLEHADLFPESTTAPSRIVSTYDYSDETRTVLYQSVRFEPKDFRQRTPDGNGGWHWKLNGVRRLVYRLPDLEGKRTVFVVEGEKDADRLWSAGLPATTNAGGAGKWRPEYTEQLKAAGCKNVVVLPDNDPPGTAHGRDVARSCTDSGLLVKLIPLPGLPPKGDVSDYLERHTKDELLALAGAAPLFQASRPVSADTPIELTSLRDLLGEPDDQIEWVVDNLIPAGAVVLFVAPPKAGKSTVAREVGYAVSRGNEFLGWRATQGTVWFLIFEDKRSEVRKHFRRLGATGTEPVRLFIDQAPADLWPRLHELAEKERPALIIVDTLTRGLKLKDISDYAEVTQRFEPLLKLTRATGAALLLLHHASVHQQREGLDAVLGSTALSGSVDNILILRRSEQVRVLSSVQRIGADIDPTVIALNAETGRLERVGSKREHDDRELGARILTALQTETEPVLESWIQDHVEGRNADKVRVLRRLLGTGQVTRYGVGGRKDPFRYFIAREPREQEHVSGSQSCSRESSGSLFDRDQREQELSTANSNVYPAILGSCSQVPYKELREQEQEPVLSTQIRVIPAHDPEVLVPVVPEVPDTSGNSRIRALPSPATPSNHKGGSCSRESRYERL